MTTQTPPPAEANERRLGRVADLIPEAKARTYTITDAAQRLSESAQVHVEQRGKPSKAMVEALLAQAEKYRRANLAEVVGTSVIDAPHLVEAQRRATLRDAEEEVAESQERTNQRLTVAEKRLQVAKAFEAAETPAPDPLEEKVEALYGGMQADGEQFSLAA